MAHLLISAAHKSSGKTTVTIGLCAALTTARRVVQPFKKGPDFIDPMWLGRAAGRPCHNLDFYTMGEAEILAVLAQHAADADLSLIEGNNGLYDGLDLEGSNSNAALARLTGAPVVLVIDVRGMTRGIAPLILGYQAFDREIRIAGVILNQVGGRRHEHKLRAVIEHYTDMPVLGAIRRDPELQVVERHLGLVPSSEHGTADAKIAAISRVVGAQVDLDRLLAIAHEATPLPPPAAAHAAPTRTPDVRIGIARDAAFGFYYPGDLDALRCAGAELVFFDTLHDTRLPDLDGLFIGGGFPETAMEQLEANRALRSEIRARIEAGLPTYAECGGLMYLTRSLSWQGRRCEMVGAIPGDVVMHERPQGHGYVRLEESPDAPWPPAPGSPPREIRAHEFHYSSLENLEGPTTFAYRVLRGHGIDGTHDGLIRKNLMACYTHLRDVECNHWAERFVRFVHSRRTTGSVSLSGPGGPGPRPSDGITA